MVDVFVISLSHDSTRHPSKKVFYDTRYTSYSYSDTYSHTLTATGRQRAEST